MIEDKIKGYIISKTKTYHKNVQSLIDIERAYVNMKSEEYIANMYVIVKLILCIFLLLILMFTSIEN